MPLIPIGARHVFIDESGDPNLDTNKAGVTDYFVITAVIVDSGKLSRIENDAWSIIRKFFPRGELKSSSLGSNKVRRVAILEAVSNLDVKYYSQVVDKSQILSESGLRFKKSFVKFIHRSVYGRLFEAYSDLHVIADEYGRSAFMREFQKYLQKRMPPRLFQTSTFQFGDSSQYPLIQIGDLISGTIGRVYSGKDPRDLLVPILDKTIIIDEWPPISPIPPPSRQLSEQDHYDLLVRHHAVSHAQVFIEENTDSMEHQVEAQVAAVRYLLYHFRSVDPEEYLPTANLHRHLEELGFPMSIRVLRNKVIGRLRDIGVFIASSGKGIKIPYGVEDLRDYAQRVNSQVIPYLKRLQVTRNHFKLASEGDLDIVNKDEFPDLYRYLSGGA